MKYSRLMQNKTGGELLRLMQLAEDDSIISFAGGFPGPEIFPAEEIEVCAAAVLRKRRSSLQYASTSGYAPLREKIAKRASIHNAVISENDILISAGSQQAIDMSARIFCDPGDFVLVETPTYIGALNAFSNYGVRYLEMPTDDEGVLIDDFRNTLSQYRAQISCAYVIPDFQNPTGRRWSIPRRRRFVEVMSEYGIPVIEDGAYRELSFEKDQYPPLYALAPQYEATVVHLGSFSKIFCPGFRVAWVLADEPVLSKYTMLKPDLDLSSSSFGQQVIDEYMIRHDMNLHVKSAIDTYRIKRDLAAGALHDYLPQAHFSFSQGGLFFWLELGDTTDTAGLLKRCLSRNIAFVPGAGFFAVEKRHNFIRLNYSNIANDLIEPGIMRIAEAIADL